MLQQLQVLMMPQPASEQEDGILGPGKTCQWVHIGPCGRSLSACLMLPLLKFVLEGPKLRLPERLTRRVPQAGKPCSQPGLIDHRHLAE